MKQRIPTPRWCGSYPEQRAEVLIAQDRLNQLRRTSSASSRKSQIAGLTDVSALTGTSF